ncbi:MAG: hypothetical protein CMF62_03715 [Magnetococcales bacterium]|nr:hypothetical protein [Magnetococcales bacterium]
MIVVRINKNDKFGISKPCADCIRDIPIEARKRGYKIKSIIYSVKDGFVKENINSLKSAHISKGRRG